MLTKTCDASQATIFRWIESLYEHGLLIEYLTTDEDEKYYTVYEMTLEYIDIHLDSGNGESYITRRDDTVDRRSRLWDDLHGGER